MRVDLTTFGAEPPESSQPGRAAQTAAAKAGAANTANGSRASTTGSVADVDQARFSSDQARVQSLANQVLAQPEIRQAKVDALQQAIGNGEYSVPPSQVAEAIVRDLGGAA